MRTAHNALIYVSFCSIFPNLAVDASVVFVPMFVSWYLRYGLLGHSLLASFLLHRATAFNFLVGPKLSEETFLSQDA